MHKILSFFDFGVTVGIYVSVYVIVVCLHRKKTDAAPHFLNVFLRSHLLSTQGFIGTEIYPLTFLYTEYAKNQYSQSFGGLVSCFISSSKNDILQLYITKDGFRKNEFFHYYVYQKQLSSSLFIGEFIFSGEQFHVIPAGANGFALVSTKNLLSMTSYGHWHGNLI